MKTNFPAERLAKIAVIAALYFALTVAIAPLAYGPVQFRFSEILVLLCFFNKDYCYSMVIGCALSNLFSPMAVLDVPVGTLATFIAVILIYKSKNLIISSVFPVILNGLIIGAEITILTPEKNIPLLFANMGTVALGELVVVTVIGVPIFYLLKKNEIVMKLIGVSKSELINASE